MMFGTIFRLRPKPGRQGDVVALFDEWQRENAPRVPGALAGYVMRPLDRPDELVGVAVFVDRASYEANANSLEQDAWYRELRALLDSDPVWQDGMFLAGGAPPQPPSGAQAVCARVTVIQSAPGRVEEGIHYIRDEVVPHATRLEGFSGGYWLVEREQGKSLAITLWASEEAMRASEEAAAQLRAGAARRVDSTTQSVERYDVVAVASPTAAQTPAAAT